MRFGTRRNGEQRKARRGSALVEFALLLPLLMVVTLGLVQYGVLMNTTSTLTNIAREGARYAALNGLNNYDAVAGNWNKSDAAIKAYMERVAAQTALKDFKIVNDASASPPKVADPKITVTISTPPETATTPATGRPAPDNRQSGNRIVVEIQYPLARKMFLPAKFFGISIWGATDPDQKYTVRTAMILQQKQESTANPTVVPHPTPTNTPIPPPPTAPPITPQPVVTPPTPTPVPTATPTPIGYRPPPTPTSAPPPPTATPKPATTPTNTPIPTSTPTPRPS